MNDIAALSSHRDGSTGYEVLGSVSPKVTAASSDKQTTNRVTGLIEMQINIEVVS